MASKWTTTLRAGFILIIAAYSTASGAADDDRRAFFNSSCIIVDEPFLLPDTVDGSSTRVAPLLVAVAGKLAGTLISGLITGVSSGLNAHAARKNTKYVAARDFDLYVADLSESPAVSINPRFGCITVVVGEFHPDSVDCTGAYIPREVSPDTLDMPESEWQTIRTDNSVENILKRANVCVTGRTKSVFEARMLFSDDRTAYRMISAGSWINSLQSTKSKRASRDLLYTLEIVEPSVGAGGRVLSTAWVNIGEVSAGDTAIDEASSSRSDWLRVPLMSRTASHAHESDTAIHQDVIGHIEALERAVVRNARLVQGLKQRTATVSPDLKKGLDKEIEKIGVRIISTEAMLDARRAEYDDLPHTKIYYMPVTMRFGITESRSERKTMQVLAAILESNNEALTNTATEMMGIDRSLDLGAGEADLVSLRTNYFDALVAVNTGSPDSNEEFQELERALALAKQSYNSARAAEGLSLID